MDISKDIQPTTTSEGDGGHNQTIGSVERTSREFDGTANLTIGEGTILIPAPTADPRGDSALKPCQTRAPSLYE